METVSLGGALRQQDERARGEGGSGPGPLQLRGAGFTMIVLPLVELGRPGFFERLQAKIAQAPGFYALAPVVLDLHATAGGAAEDFAELRRRLAALGLALIGVTGGDEAQDAAAGEAGLAALPSWRAGQMPASAPQAAIARPSLIVNQPVRSGRQIYAEGADLIVTAAVGAGAELLADGCIHVYGPLRGRALAGISGDRGARIFCRRLEAELVSVAGMYRVAEDIAQSVYGRPAQIRLDNEALRIDAVD